MCFDKKNKFTMFCLMLAPYVAPHTHTHTHPIQDGKPKTCGAHMTHMSNISQNHHLNHYGLFYWVICPALKVKGCMLSGIRVWGCFLNFATSSRGQIELYSWLKNIFLCCTLLFKITICTLNITLFIQITNADGYILFKQEKKRQR